MSNWTRTIRYLIPISGYRLNRVRIKAGLMFHGQNGATIMFRNYSDASEDLFCPSYSNGVRRTLERLTQSKYQRTT